jgi:hypothetical protein
MGSTVGPVVVIATPCYSGDFPEMYVQSMMATFSNLARTNIRLAWAPLCGWPYLVQARSLLLYQFLAMPEATHLLWIDADMAWEWDSIPKLLATGHDVIGAPYISRHEIRKTHSEMAGKEVIEDVVEVDGAGTGFLMLSRRAAQLLSDMATEFTTFEVCGRDVTVPMATPTSTLNGKLMTEDIAMCRALSAKGYPTYLHLGVRVGHQRKHLGFLDQAELRERFTFLETLG